MECAPHLRRCALAVSGDKLVTLPSANESHENERTLVRTHAQTHTRTCCTRVACRLLHPRCMLRSHMATEGRCGDRWCVAHREQVYRGVGEQRVHVFRRSAEPPAVAGRRCGRCVLP